MSGNQWYIENGRLTHEGLPAPLSGGYFTEPYPNNFWYVDGNKLTHRGLPNPLSGGYFAKPYPYGWWYVDEGRLTNAALPEPLNLGCFYNCTSLRKVTIPAYVSKIWSESFKGTQLKKVTISENCAYEPDSFPPDCVIEHYEDNEE